MDFSQTKSIAWPQEIFIVEQQFAIWNHYQNHNQIIVKLAINWQVNVQPIDRKHIKEQELLFINDCLMILMFIKNLLSHSVSTTI